MPDWAGDKVQETKKMSPEQLTEQILAWAKSHNKRVKNTGDRLVRKPLK